MYIHSTSQPSLNAFVACTEGAAYDTGIDYLTLELYDNYWARVRAMYAPFESGMYRCDYTVCVYRQCIHVVAILSCIIIYAHTKHPLLYTGMLSGTARVYDHQIPGGQYSNLLVQCASMGLADRWEEVLDAYRDVNALLGDIVKVCVCITSVCMYTVYTLDVYVYCNCGCNYNVVQVWFIYM